ncbi:hypothetical protein BGZ57DRAFT_913495 [Hyaloscypha finlandica]|nr:hypothetical protein BGZ57DRAFT_913495 [Hyaloscypha finlandica]
MRGWWLVVTLFTVSLLINCPTSMTSISSDAVLYGVDSCSSMLLLASLPLLRSCLIEVSAHESYIDIANEARRRQLRANSLRSREQAAIICRRSMIGIVCVGLDGGDVRALRLVNGARGTRTATAGDYGGKTTTKPLDRRHSTGFAQCLGVCFGARSTGFGWTSKAGCNLVWRYWERRNAGRIDTFLSHMSFAL